MLAIMNLILAVAAVSLLVAAVFIRVKNRIPMTSRRIVTSVITFVSGIFLILYTGTSVIHIYRYRIFELSQTDYKIAGGNPDYQITLFIACVLMWIIVSGFYSESKGRNK